MFLLGLGAALVLRRAARHLDDRRDEALVERLIALRDSAFRRAWTAIVAVLGGLLAMMLGLSDAVNTATCRPLLRLRDRCRPHPARPALTWSTDEL